MVEELVIPETVLEVVPAIEVKVVLEEVEMSVIEGVEVELEVMVAIIMEQIEVSEEMVSVAV